MTWLGSPLRMSSTMRIPWRALSSRMSEMPSIRLSFTSSTIFSISRVLLSW